MTPTTEISSNISVINNIYELPPLTSALTTLAFVTQFVISAPTASSVAAILIAPTAVK